MSMAANGMRILGVSSKLEHQMVQDHQFLGSPKEDLGLKMVVHGIGGKSIIIALMVESVVEVGKASWLHSLEKILPSQVPKSVVKGCWDPAKQSSDTPNKWTCDKKCLIPNEFGDEIMLSVDMGLYLNFTTKKEWGGRPMGCPGMDELTYVKRTQIGTFSDGKKLKLKKGKANYFHYCSRNPPNHGDGKDVKFSKVECE